MTSTLGYSSCFRSRFDRLIHKKSKLRVVVPIITNKFITICIHYYINVKLYWFVSEPANTNISPEQAMAVTNISSSVRQGVFQMSTGMFIITCHTLCSKQFWLCIFIIDRSGGYKVKILNENKKENTLFFLLNAFLAATCWFYFSIYANIYNRYI